MQHEMLFVNPVFNEEGLNVTVRAGDKWMEANVGDELICKDTDTYEVLRRATIVGKAYIPCDLISETWLKFEHDPNCMDYPGLFRVMKEVYPNFTENSLVTVIFFKILN